MKNALIVFCAIPPKAPFSCIFLHFLHFLHLISSSVDSVLIAKKIFPKLIVYTVLRGYFTLNIGLADSEAHDAPPNYALLPPKLGRMLAPRPPAAPLFWSILPPPWRKGVGT